jgi:hypothetical protein
MADLLRERAADILGFLLSFTVIARLWLAQHSIVSVLVRQNPLVVGPSTGFGAPGSAGLEQAPVVDPRLHRAVIRPARRPAGPR